MLMRNNMIFFGFFLASVFSCFYVLAMDESGSHEYDSADSEEMDRDLGRAYKSYKKGDYLRAEKKIVSMALNKEKSVIDFTIVFRILEEAGKQRLQEKETRRAPKQNGVQEAIDVIAMNFIRGDFELTKKNFSTMPAGLKNQLPSIYVAMEKALYASNDGLSYDDYTAQIEEVTNMMEQPGSKFAAAPLLIKLRVAVQSEWPKNFRNAALAAIKAHAANERAEKKPEIEKGKRKDAGGANTKKSDASRTAKASRALADTTNKQQ
jgi:hypothetical protein